MGPFSKLCATHPFSINFRCQIENQVSDYRLLGASSFIFYPTFMFLLTHPTQMVTCYIAVTYRHLSYAPSSVSVRSSLFWKKTGPLEPNFIGNFQLMVRCLPNLCWFFFIGNAQQKHEALIKGCLLFLCMQHLLFNWCWWFYLSVHFIQFSLCIIQQSLYGFYSF